MDFSKEIFTQKLEIFSNEVGVSGHEDAIAKLLSTTFKEQNLFVRRDALGGIYASNIDFTQPSRRKRVLICGHMDEVGFMAKEILPNGLVKVNNIGGIVLESLFGVRVCYFGNGKKVGVFTALPAHFAVENVIKTRDLAIDFGFEDDVEARKFGMNEGTVISFDTTFVKTANEHRFIGKALDNRYSCAMLATLSQTIFTDLFANEEIDVILGATVMEEIGLKGAEAAINMIKPDFTIVLDCSPAADTLPKDNKNGVLGKGMLYRYMDRTMIMTERVKRYFLIVLDKHSIRYQPYVSSGGTDAGRIMELNKGIPTVTCCVPSRYIHNSSAIIDIRDAEEAYKAIWSLAQNYKEDIHNYLHYKNEAE
ncbi:MAG: hypothetical protein ACRC6X_03810 [Culicoidibacterales bacterium]